MKQCMATPPVTLTFAEDDDFSIMFREDLLPNMQVVRRDHTQPSAAPPRVVLPAVPPSQPQRQNSEVIELLDDD